jgi:hypothetical protein
MAVASPEARTLLQDAQNEHDLIAKIIADLAVDCEEAFTRPPSSFRRSTDTCSTRTGKRKDFNQILPGNSVTTSMSSQQSDEVGGTPQKAQAGPCSVDSERSSFSQPSTMQRDVITDSVLNLMKEKDKQTSTSKKSGLRCTLSADSEPATPPSESDEQREEMEKPPTYPSAAKTAVIMIALYISIFLVALDRTIIGPAIPAITNQFNSIGDIGWYGSSYMLTSAGFILLYGRIYTFFSTKKVFLSGIFLFEAGSAVCGAAQTSTMLIVGRAIAGLGSSGIFTGAILIMLNTVPLHQRPLLQGLFGACFGVASVAGPLLGGAFTGSKNL